MLKRVVLVTFAAACDRGSPALYPLSPTQLGAVSAANAEPTSAERAPNAQALDAALGTDCELRLFLEQLPSPGVEGISKGSIGVMAVEALGTGDEVLNGVCIKRAGQPLELPAAMLVASTACGPRLGRFCQGETEPSSLKIKAGAKLTDVTACTWNGVFHSTRPFTVTLLAASERSVSDYVEFLRIYRNGDLVAAWNKVSDHKANKVVVPGSSLITGILAATHPPHLTAMDIRIIPRDASVAQAVDTAVRDDHKLFKERLGKALSAAANETLPSGSLEDFECLRKRVRKAAFDLRRIVDGGVEMVVLQGRCTPLSDATSTPLSDAYADLKNQSGEQVEKLRSQAYTEIDALKARVLEKLKPEQEKLLAALVASALTHVDGAPNEKRIIQQCIDDLIEHKAGESCSEALTQAEPEAVAQILATFQTLDADVKALRAIADEAQALALALARKAKDVAADPARQAQIFNAVVQSLAEQESTFEPRKNNPPLLAGEQRLELEYSDAFQWFLLAPWNGVPLQLAHGLDADLSAAVTIPFLDVIGARAQWGKSRFAEMRGALGVGYAVTNGTPEGETAATEQAAWLPTFSLGIGTFKVGVGYALMAEIAKPRDRVRLVVGADLFKLISGSDVELF